MAPHMLPLAVIFDMDGLIFDTEALYKEALEEVAAELRLGVIDEGAVRATVGAPWQRTRAHFAQLLGADFDVDVLRARWIARFDALAHTRLAMKPGVVALLDMLEAAGIARGVATGSMRAVAHRHLRAHGILGRFGAVIANEDCAAGKPAPEPFVRAARALGVAAGRCWALEDSPNGVISARGAGMHVIMVPDLIAPDAATRGLCGAVVDSLDAVCDLLKGAGAR